MFMSLYSYKLGYKWTKERLLEHSTSNPWFSDAFWLLQNALDWIFKKILGLKFLSRKDLFVDDCSFDFVHTKKRERERVFSAVLQN